MHFQSYNFLLIGLVSVVLLGAGCAKQEVAPEPKPGVIQEVSLPEDLSDGERRARQPSPPISELETPSPISSPYDEPVCPVTVDIVRAQCNIKSSLSVSARGSMSAPGGCQFDIGGAYQIGFYLRIAPSERFGETTEGPGASPGATVAQVVEAERLGTNVAVRVANRSLPGAMHTCARWETRPVVGLGDEALMTPVGDIGCKTDDGFHRFTDTAGTSLYIRKGATIAKVSAFETGVGSAECSPEEITRIARDYVVPAMNP